MTPPKARTIALAFFDAYSDPDIEKRLYFDVWADRAGLSVEDKRTVWREVRQLTYRFAAQKRAVTRRSKTATRTPVGGVATRQHASVSATE